MTDHTSIGGAFEDAARHNKDSLFLHVGKRLRRRRRLLGLTQPQLGEQANIRYQQIQKFEAGGRVSIDKLIDLGKALNTPLEYFLPDQYKPKPVTPIDMSYLAEVDRQVQSLSPKKKAALQKFMNYEPGLSEQFTTAARDNKDELFEYIGQQIRRRRKLLGLSQQELADLIDVRFQQIQKYETNGNKPGVDTLIDLANAMNTPGGLEYFLPPQYQSEMARRPAGMHPDLHELIQIQMLSGEGKSVSSIVKKAIDAALDLKNNIPQAIVTLKPEDPSP